jgi:murein DD-endopeptidase MepM/ murein hydrolase activator NlpD
MPLHRHMVRALVVVSFVTHAGPAAPPAKKPLAPPPREVPPVFFVEYPAAEQFCLPIRSALSDAATTHTGKMKAGRVVVQHLNGGYGVAMMTAKNGQALLHTGADLGWFKVGEPVFAIADGAVRVSQGGIKPLLNKAGIHVPSNKPLDYGNLIVIEHRLPDGTPFCSLYGHLGDDRSVFEGDLVTAGQQIGTIGRNSGSVNGGYEPHVHFAIRDGGWAVPGREMMTLRGADGELKVTLVEAADEQLRVSIAPEPPPNLRLNTMGATIEIKRDGDAYVLPSFLLYGAQPRDLHFEGYSPVLDGWHDPVAFLKENRTDQNAASFMFISPFPRKQDDPLHYALRKPAGEWKIDRWLTRTDGQETQLDVADFRGRTVCLFALQATCRASQTHGWPAAISVAKHFSNNDGVSVVVLQTAVETPRNNSPANLEKQIRQFVPDGLPLAVGHCAGDKDPPPIVTNYHLRGTPWCVLIDREGTVQFSNYCVRPEELIRRIDELQTDESL